MPSLPSRTALLKNSVRLILFCLPLLLATPSKAQAYTDPGTGAFVFQAAYAAFLGGTYYFRKFLDRVWRRRSSQESSTGAIPNEGRK
jgi:hypothetical protein